MNGEHSSGAGCSADAAGVRSAAAGRNESIAGRVFKVLLVENEVVVCKLLDTLLKRCKYEVVVARNGRQALEVLTSDVERTIDIVLTDNFMPEVSGIDLVRKVVSDRRWQHMPVVMMSSDSRKEVVLEALQAGAVDFLVKPVRRNELATLWQHAWRARRPACPTADQRTSGTTQAGRKTSEGGAQSTAEDSNFSVQTGAASTAAFRPTTQACRAKRSFSDELPQQSKRPRFSDGSTGAGTVFKAGDGACSAPSNSQLLSRSGSLPDAWRSTLEDTTKAAVLLAGRSARPTGVEDGAVLEIKPLDLGAGGLARASSLETGSMHFPALGMLPAPGRPDEASQRGMSLFTAFPALMAMAPLSCASQQAEGLLAQLAFSSSPRISSQGPAGPQQHANHLSFAQASSQPSGSDACAANRKAAIAKFRAKRSQRNFDKVVRYASRQRLAETRPRVRGQFVKADAPAAPEGDDEPGCEVAASEGA